MHYLTPEEIGQSVEKARKILGLRQRDVALVCGTGVRFIVDLEKGKPTCQMGKVLRVLRMLGIQSRLQLPEAPPHE
jgi:HTH-type transcriptional regulator / antitoxin HipB